MQNAIILCATVRFRTLVYEKTDVHTYAYENTNLRSKTLPELQSESPKATFLHAKGYLSQGKRLPFADQKAAFYNTLSINSLRHTL